VMRLVDRPEFIDEPWFASGSERAEHADELDEAVAVWIAEREGDEVIATFEEAQAAVAPIYDVRDVLADPQFAALDSITTVDDDELGPLRMQNVLFRLGRTPGRITSAGPSLGQHTAEVLARYGVDEAELARLREQGKA
jgi:crotonobetainyl-CoA:carnitine CoA-transferase CaiB-like acyl-CoA transferase